MSFNRVSVEILSLERRVSELVKLGKGKTLEIKRFSGDFSRPEIAPVIKFLSSETTPTEVDLELLNNFVAGNVSLDAGGMNVSAGYTSEEHTLLVDAALCRLSTGKQELFSFVEFFCLVKGLLNEPQVQEKFDPALLLRSISCAEANPGVREEATRCLLLILKNGSSRDSLIRTESNQEVLLQWMNDLSLLLRNDEVSSNSEARLLVLLIKSFFLGTDGDELIAKLMVKSSLLSSVIERVAKAFLEISDKDVQGLTTLVSTSFEGLSRGNLLVDGFRLLFIVATYSKQDMLLALLANEGQPPLQGQDLESCDLRHAHLAMGDRYVFLQTQTLLLEFDQDLVLGKDFGNLDQVKIRVCNLLLFADSAPGFVSYLYRHKVGPKLVDLLHRQTSRALEDGNPNKYNHLDDLLPLLMAFKTLMDESPDFKDEFQELFFDNLLGDLQADEFATKELFEEAKERRHFAGRSVPGTVFGNCVKLLTSFNDNVKRVSGELLFSLCDEDSNKVTKLVGFGHAAHLLAIKGGMMGNIMAGQQ